ncbi:helix-turn-helix domain-containing protein [Halorarum halobium]|uniref:helix-turn-helix domain-containing protein n=1 Tax=Halorarum halobium TaxID=3075121 RepID=UPI0028A82A3F|nr:helix-turn-helix domain-containing protein [Halobaculum sp. XH14]
MNRDDTPPEHRSENDPAEPNGPVASPAADDLYRALSDETRRRTLWYLLHGGTVSTGELADVLSGWRATSSGAPVGPAEHEDVSIRLHHGHIPMLEDAGLVVHDADADDVRLVPVAAPVREIIRAAVEYESFLESVRSG